MSDLVIDHQFVRALAKSLRTITGKEAKHTESLDAIAEARGWKTDALMHALKAQQRAADAANQPPLVFDEQCLACARAHYFTPPEKGQSPVFRRPIISNAFQR